MSCSSLRALFTVGDLVAVYSVGPNTDSVIIPRTTVNRCDRIHAGELLMSTSGIGHASECFDMYGVAGSEYGFPESALRKIEPDEYDEPADTTKSDEPVEGTVH